MDGAIDVGEVDADGVQGRAEGHGRASIELAASSGPTMPTKAVGAAEYAEKARAARHSGRILTEIKRLDAEALPEEHRRWAADR
ncbi:hypothetical protein ACFYTQ_05250 [Nocardia sp. NPDC004068]|uniref:hypothetical protein n=1 Tax=Nocardia sp. NPDC004068 TaxID=3364303 RepID=UPI00367C0684